MIRGKKILLGVTGSIAAYKTAELVRLFVKSGAEVKVIMTSASVGFVTPLTLSTVSKNPVSIKFTKDNRTGEWQNHVELALWADVFLIAPVSANTLAKMSTGICDNLLMAVYFSAKCPVFFAPAMDLDMYKHPTVKNNIQNVIAFGNHEIKSGYGELASGLVGEGRMSEPSAIFSEIEKHFYSQKILVGKKIMVTAGPTYESIDPVRYLGNNSSGKMGYALAEAFAAMGAEVTLISGPVHIQHNHPSITLIKVITAKDMLDASLKVFKSTDITVMAAAVADFTPRIRADKKIKKGEGKDKIELIPTEDILLSLGRLKTRKQILVGFALETDNEEANAIDKINRKQLDFIVLNSLRDNGAGFGVDTNKITIIDREGKREKFELKSKKEVASDIIKRIITLLTS